MFIGAILIGLLTAYYFGIKHGIVAAATSAVLFIIADIVPGTTLIIYGTVAVFIAGVALLGPRFVKPEEEQGGRKVRRLAKQALGKLWRWM